MIESIILNQGRILPCSVELKGEYSISDGACLCVPVKLTNKGAEKVFEIKLAADESAAFKASYEAYLDMRKTALACL